MGMGYGANIANVIQWASVKKLIPGETTRLEETLARYGIEQDDYFQTLATEDDEQTACTEIVENYIDDELLTEQQLELIVEELVAIWRDVQDAFVRATQVGESYLDLQVGYHNSEEEGGRYDDVDGVYFAVSGCEQLSPAGAQFQDIITPSFFVRFG